MQGRIYQNYLEQCWRKSQEQKEDKPDTPKPATLLERLQNRPFDLNQRKLVYSIELLNATDSNIPCHITDPFLALWHTHTQEIRDFKEEEALFTLPLQMNPSQLQTLLLRYEHLLKSITYPLKIELSRILQEADPSISDDQIAEMIYPYIRGYVFNIFSSSTRLQLDKDNLLLQEFYHLIRNTIFPSTSTTSADEIEIRFLNLVKDKFSYFPTIEKFKQLQQILGALAEICLLESLKDNRRLQPLELQSLRDNFLPLLTNDTRKVELEGFIDTYLSQHTSLSQDSSFNNSPRSTTSCSGSPRSQSHLLARIRSSFSTKLTDALSSSASSPPPSPLRSPASSTASTPPDSPSAAASLSAPSLSSPHTSAPTSPASARRLSLLFLEKRNSPKKPRNSSVSLQPESLKP